MTDLSGVNLKRLVGGGEVHDLPLRGDRIVWRVCNKIVRNVPLECPEALTQDLKSVKQAQSRTAYTTLKVGRNVHAARLRVMCFEAQLLRSGTSFQRDKKNSPARLIIVLCYIFDEPMNLEA